MGGGLADGRSLQPQQIDRVLHPHLRTLVLRHGEFRVEIHIQATCLIEEFEIGDGGRFRPYIPHMQHLAPAIMADDDIRLHAHAGQLQRPVMGAAGADHAGFEIHRIGVDTRG
jgi:hypothetical protein